MSGGIAGRGINRLGDKQVRAFIRNAKAGKARTKKLSDGRGLYLTITPAGSPVWRLKYRYGGKERLYAIGVYPEISLESARTELDRVRALLREGRDPVSERRLAREMQRASDEVTFGQIALEWLERRKAHKKWSPIHYKKTRQALERDILPSLGHFPIARITPRMVTAAFNPVLARGAHETASKLLQNVVRIFARAKNLHHIASNPAVDLREELIPERDAEVHHPALIEFPELGQLLRDFDKAHVQARVTPQIRMLNRLIAFTAVRHANALSATWSQFDLDAEVPVWVIPRASMKSKKGADFRVPLPPTIAAELRHWKNATGGQGYLFASPTPHRETLTLDALSKAYRSLGYSGRHTPHGWRSAFSTRANESKQFDATAVELSLDHVVGTKVQRAYDHGERWEERVQLSFWWDAQLTAAQNGTQPLDTQRRLASA